MGSQRRMATSLRSSLRSQTRGNRAPTAAITHLGTGIRSGSCWKTHQGPGMKRRTPIQAFPEGPIARLKTRSPTLLPSDNHTRARRSHLSGEYDHCTNCEYSFSHDLPLNRFSNFFLEINAPEEIFLKSISCPFILLGKYSPDK